VNGVQPSGGIRGRLGTLGAYSQGAWNSLSQMASRRREPEWIPVQVCLPSTFEIDSGLVQG